jgi:methionine-rich copper-binding protein CopC
MEAVSTPETSANVYEITWRNISEDGHLYVAVADLS